MIIGAASVAVVVCVVMLVRFSSQMGQEKVIRKEGLGTGMEPLQVGTDSAKQACPPCPSTLALGCPRPKPCPGAPAALPPPIVDGGGHAEECPPCEACPACPACPASAGGAKLSVGDDDFEMPIIEVEPDTSYVDDDFTPRDPLNIIYLHSPFHWPWHLDHWLRGVARPVRMYIDPSGTKCMRNSIVVVNHLAVKRENSKLDPNKYFETCRKADVHTIGVFHTGDLKMDQNYGYYKKAAFVYRNHFPSKEQARKLNLPMDKIRLLPLGSLRLESISLDNFYQVGLVRLLTVFCV